MALWLFTIGALALAAPAPIPALAGCCWSPAAPMAQAREGHTATLLGNGDVLVVGGSLDAGLVNLITGAELYDARTNQWSPAGSMQYPRFLHTATLLPDGRVLVAGGITSTGHATTTAELYDPASRSWSSAGGMAVQRYNHTATLLKNGRVLVTGGQNAGGYVARAELYDPNANNWSPVATMDAGYFGATATLLQDGRVLVVGGETLGDGRAELYDPGTNRWSNAGIMRRRGHTATLLVSGKVLVAGGDTASAQLYDPPTNRWSDAAPMLVSRVSHVATLLADGRVLVTGGGSFIGQTQVWLSSAEVYDPKADRWDPGGCMADSRWAHTATLLADNRVLVTGGWVPSENGGRSLTGAELLEGASGGGPFGPATCQTVSVPEAVSASPSTPASAIAVSSPPPTISTRSPSSSPSQPLIATLITTATAYRAALALGVLGAMVVAGIVRLWRRRRRRSF